MPITRGLELSQNDQSEKITFVYAQTDIPSENDLKYKSSTLIKQ